MAQEKSSKGEPNCLIEVCLGRALNKAYINEKNIIKIGKPCKVYLNEGYDSQVYSRAVSNKADITQDEGLGCYLRFTYRVKRIDKRRRNCHYLEAFPVSKDMSEKEIYECVEKYTLPEGYERADPVVPVVLPTEGYERTSPAIPAALPAFSTGFAHFFPNSDSLVFQNSSNFFKVSPFHEGATMYSQQHRERVEPNKEDKEINSM